MKTNRKNGKIKGEKNVQGNVKRITNNNESQTTARDSSTRVPPQPTFTRVGTPNSTEKVDQSCREENERFGLGASRFKKTWGLGGNHRKLDGVGRGDLFKNRRQPLRKEEDIGKEKQRNEQAILPQCLPSHFFSRSDTCNFSSSSSQGSTPPSPPLASTFRTFSSLAFSLNTVGKMKATVSGIMASMLRPHVRSVLLLSYGVDAGPVQVEGVL
ncbi:hypothetical protein IE53DRAFT_285039 [Violaceomyces palustris]|uniref:Uncharacterized protein n=1 Tax=Violaceomyces palustris TaxID=1673888 RepID=A0ACD0NM25_9BASI|nr:hypothetical protein IE53DRAFT_285039 [Violaceomyces palustris]